MQVSELIHKINEPQTILMAKLSRELKAKGIEVTDLSLGEPDFDTPVHIKDAAKKALDEGWTKYPPVAGFPELKEAICTKLKRDNDLTYTPNNIVVSAGAKHSLSNLFASLLNDGDEVIIPTPYWVTYASQVEMYGGKSVFVPCNIDDNFKLTADKLEAAITPNTKVLVYSSPCNPSGAVYSKEELSALKDVLVKYPNITVISDEIYEYINYTDKHYSMAHFEELKERVAVVNGFSKGYAMTGWRLGYIATNESLAKACEKLQSQVTSGVNSIAQRAAITALLGDMNPTEQMRLAFQKRKEYFINALNEIKGLKVSEPEGAFYAFVDISDLFGKKYNDKAINNATEFAMYLLETGHVTGVSGSAFGDNNCIRFSFATSMENLEKAIDKIKIAVNQLNN